MNNQQLAAIVLLICSSVCCICASMQAVNCKKIEDAKPVEACIPADDFKPEKIQVVDTAGTNHTILTRQFGFQPNELIKTVEGHELVYWIDKTNNKLGRPVLIHVKPCMKCYEIKFKQKKAAEGKQR